MKYLRVKMPDGSKWDVPARIIASDRALYYANEEEGTPEQKEFTFNNEFQYAMGDDSELYDWAQGNMNWEDVEVHAVKCADSTKVNYQEGWINGTKEMVEHD